MSRAGWLHNKKNIVRTLEATSVDKNNGTNGKFYREVAILMYIRKNSFETKTTPRTGH